MSDHKSFWKQAAYTLLSVCIALSIFTNSSIKRSQAQITSDVVHQYNLRVTGPTGTEQRVLITIPRLPGHAMNPPGKRWPLLIALHGRGESSLGPSRGHLGWNVQYGLPHAFEALLRGRLTLNDWGGFVRPSHFAQVNQELERRRFQGVAVVTPFVPDVLAPGREQVLAQYETWLAGSLLEQVRREYPGLSQTREGTGIDGISMGGRVALSTGLKHPEVFGSVGGMQPAVRGDAERLSAMAHHDRPQHIRLLSSDQDPFLNATRELSQAFRARSIPHDLVIVPGPHDYAFNRGPGGIELLRYHEQVLVGERVSR